jgi:hypothetical protein
LEVIWIAKETNVKNKEEFMLQEEAYQRGEKEGQDELSDKPVQRSKNA